jgi:hypothetical protein
MTDQIFSPEEEGTCPCGALLEEGRTTCVKCRARTRWLRRQVGRRVAVRRPGGARRPAGRPSRQAEAGVSWI